MTRSDSPFDRYATIHTRIEHSFHLSEPAPCGGDQPRFIASGTIQPDGAIFSLKLQGSHEVTVRMSDWENIARHVQALIEKSQKIPN